jgi:hypothetical protein
MKGQYPALRGCAAHEQGARDCLEKLIVGKDFLFVGLIGKALFNW